MITLEKFWLVVFSSAILVSIFYAAPQLLIWSHLSDLEKNYEAVQITHRGDITQTYLPRAREVYDGYFPPTDIHISSPAGLFTVMPAIPPLVFSLILKLAQGNINVSFILAELIFPATIFIFAYALGVYFIKNKMWALLFSFFWTLTPLSMHLPKAFSNLDNFLNIIVKNFYPFVNTNLDKLFLDRIDDPFLTYPFLIIALISIFFFWEKPKKTTAIFMGCAVGLLAYVYFHYWVYLTIVLGLIFLWNVFIDCKKNKQRFKKGIIMVSIFILVVSPYLYNYYKFNSLESSSDYVNRIGIEQGRFFRLFEPFSIAFDYIFYIILSVLIYFILFKKDNKERAILYWIFIIGMFLVWNIQLVTGFVPVPDHWSKAISPVILIILFDILYNLFKNFKQRRVSLIIIILISLLITKKTVNAIHFMVPEEKFVSSGTSEFTYSFDNNMMGSWNWVNLELPNEPKIVSDSFLTSFYTLSYTSARSYLMTWCNSLASNEEIASRFLLTNKIFDVDPNTVSDRLKGGIFLKEGDRHTAFNEFKSAQHAFGNYFKKEDTSDFRYVSEYYFKKMIKDYKEINILDGYNESGYIYYGPWERQFSSIDFNANSGLELSFKNSSVEIYKILK